MPIALEYILKIIYTKHTKKRMIERSIKSSWIEDCIELPDYNIARERIVESYKKINSEVLKVVWIRMDSFIKVISVMWK